MLNIEKVDYTNVVQADDLVNLLDLYARDPMGGGAPLPDEVSKQLVSELAAFGHAHSWLGYYQEQPVALVNAFDGFSTFKARRLLNIHDVVVHPEFRGRGFSKQMLEVVEAFSRQHDYCKMTLEVLSNNRVAQGAYRSTGFGGYELDPEAGHALFWQKWL